MLDLIGWAVVGAIVIAIAILAVRGGREKRSAQEWADDQW